MLGFDAPPPPPPGAAGRAAPAQTPPPGTATKEGGGCWAQGDPGGPSTRGGARVTSMQTFPRGISGPAPPRPTELLAVQFVQNLKTALGPRHK